MSERLRKRLDKLDAANRQLEIITVPPGVDRIDLIVQHAKDPWTQVMEEVDWRL